MKPIKFLKQWSIYHQENRLKVIIDDIETDYSPHKLALVKVCLDIREAYYKCFKPIFNLGNLYNILLIQQKVAEILKEGCNLEVILYMKTLTSKNISV